MSTPLIILIIFFVWVLASLLNIYYRGFDRSYAEIQKRLKRKFDKDTTPQSFTIMLYGMWAIVIVLAFLIIAGRSYGAPFLFYYTETSYIRQLSIIAALTLFLCTKYRNSASFNFGLCKYLYSISANELLTLSENSCCTSSKNPLAVSLSRSSHDAIYLLTKSST
jgi:magnesium-transporting ATPase (P-type)